MNSKENRKYWETIIHNQMESGLSQNRWCEENNTKVSTFRYWKHKMFSNKPLEKAEKTTWTKVTPITDTQLCNSKIEVKIGQATLLIDKFFDEEILHKLMGILTKHV
ncbi:hypothetical protein IZY60_15250 [Lutibacter sp. B2]|nr:hypothetical protein [Lutibacter sp. B2]